MKISVVISAYNEEAKIEACLKSVKEIADEIILVDNTSYDRTVQIAKKYTDKIFTKENNQMLNVNKNFGFGKAKNEWILNLDADERVTPELSNEIKSLSGDAIAGYYIPRKNIIFGKWIRHTGWYPDYVLRLFKKNNGRFEEKHVHEMIAVDGATGKLENPIEHLNYDTVSQFLNKMIKTYTVSEADNLMKEGYVYNAIDIVKMPLSEFVKRYFAEQGFKDGMHGLTLSLLQAFYHFIVFLRLWEANNYPDQNNTVQIIEDGRGMIRHEFNYWMLHEKISSEKNIIKKQLLKIKRKTLS